MKNTNFKKASVFIILGQSNAVGHGIPMQEKDIINTPLTNVFGLSRDSNQSFDNSKLIWSGYTSHSMNLAEAQDNTYSIPNILAAAWQQKIDSGENLSDLYIVQIAIGAEGVSEKYMWYPKREPKLIPGALGTVDISLFPFAIHIFSLIDESFKAMNMEYEIMGLHWRGGEEDVCSEIGDLKKTLKSIYKIIFDSFNKELNYPPIVLHRLCCPDRMNDINSNGKPLENMNYINTVFEELCRENDNISLFDARQLPQYVPNIRGNGIFIEDAVHFTPDANRTITNIIINNYINP